MTETTEPTATEDELEVVDTPERVDADAEGTPEVVEAEVVEDAPVEDATDDTEVEREPSSMAGRVDEDTDEAVADDG